MPFEWTTMPQVRARSGPELLGLVHELIGLGFDTEDFLVAGSARLAVEGIIHRVSDLDVLVRPGGRTWRNAMDLALDEASERGAASLGTSRYTGHSIARLRGGAIEMFDTWLIPESSTEQLLERADVLDGVKYLPLGDIIAYKRRLDRTKDRKDCAEIQAHQERLRSGHPDASPYAMLL